MFDPNFDIVFRDFMFNDASIDDSVVAGGAIGSGISGCVIDTLEPTDVDVVQFLEKRSLQDGMDAGDVFLGARRIRAAGTLYDVTRALLFDRLQLMRKAMSPTLAQREEPADKGYRPMYGSVPTNRLEDYPAGAIDLRVLALPLGLSYGIQRKQIGGGDGDALAIPWQGVWLCRNPSIMAETEVTTNISAGSQAASGTITNRGDYHAPLNILLVVNTGAATVVFNIGGSILTITVPAGTTFDRTVRYNGSEKTLTVEENAVEVLHMDYLTFSQATTHPLVNGGDSAWSMTCTTANLLTGSRFWFWEEYA